MRAEVIAVGSEMLLFGRSDTNGDWLCARLAEHGIDVTRRTIVKDDEREIAEAIAGARGRSRWVIVTGGLGPTADDVTREGLARALGRPLAVREEIREALAARMTARGYRVGRSAEMQARVPEGVQAIDNRLGSAPGLLDPGPPCWTLVLPGVPHEMREMFADVVSGPLRGELAGRRVPVARALVAGLSESEVDRRLEGLIGELPDARVTILASEQGVELHVQARGRDEAAAPPEPPDARPEAGAGAGAIERIRAEITVRLGDAVAAWGDDSLPAVVGGLLRARRARLAVAESCTGGLLGGALTSVPGSSEWFVGGVIAYSDELKRELLGVPAALLDRHGAVSEPVARAMAEGARVRTRATHALSVTGIAGPDGGSPEKPVGLVHIALAAPEGTAARRLLLTGDRTRVRARAASSALDLLRRSLQETGA